LGEVCPSTIISINSNLVRFFQTSGDGERAIAIHSVEGLGLTRLVAFFQSLPPALVNAALAVAIPKVALHVKQFGGECDPHDHIIRAMQLGLFCGFEPARRLISQDQCG